MSKKRTYNTVRTDHLENVIAMHIFKGQYAEADAITRLAYSISAPISEDKIKEIVSTYRKIESESV